MEISSLWKPEFKSSSKIEGGREGAALEREGGDRVCVASSIGSILTNPAAVGEATDGAGRMTEGELILTMTTIVTRPSEAARLILLSH